MIELGTYASDVITGFAGTVTGKASYITGCDQYLLSPKGADKQPSWFDEQRLRVDEDVPVIVLDNSKGKGADIAAPIK